MKLIVFFCLIFSSQAFSKLRVLTTTTNLKDLVEVIGKEKVEVSSLSKGSQDPHFLEAKPSFMLKAMKADLLVSIGLSLEDAWLSLVIRGGRNPKLKRGGSARFVASDYIKVLEATSKKVSRADGDVHPEGNPHFMLDPISMLAVGKNLAEKLAKLDPSNANFYIENMKKFEVLVRQKMKTWNAYFSKKLKVITYHKTLSYFYQRFGVKNIGYLEPKPGIPPTASHILGIIQKIKTYQVSKIVIENYFDPSVGKRLKKEFPQIVIESIPVAVGGSEKASSLLELYEVLVKKIGEKG